LAHKTTFIFSLHDHTLEYAILTIVLGRQQGTEHINALFTAPHFDTSLKYTVTKMASKAMWEVDPETRSKVI
jgi:hypothetical protein